MTDLALVARLAREAGGYFANDECDCCHEITFGSVDELAKFAALVAAECAKIAETVPQEAFCTQAHMAMRDTNRAAIVAAIRARFKETP
jgi:hypothetical protein